MTFGLETTDNVKTTVRVKGIDNIKPFLDTFHKFGHTELDTARIYCLGDTETVKISLPRNKNTLFLTLLSRSHNLFFFLLKNEGFGSLAHR